MNSPVSWIVPAKVPRAVWFTMKNWPPLSIVAVFVPLLGAVIVPLKEPTVVPAAVDRLSRTAVPAPLLGLLTARGPVVAPKVAPVVATVSVPPLTIVPPV